MHMGVGVGIGAGVGVGVGVGLLCTYLWEHKIHKLYVERPAHEVVSFLFIMLFVAFCVYTKQ